jgi:POT family proton-dependent oligopeptide transporter
VLYSSQFFADSQGIVSSNWIILSYFFQSTGELLVSGLGLAMVARFVPQRLMGFLMGTWFTASAGGMMLGGFVASLTNIPKGLSSVESLPVYTHTFLHIGLSTFVIAVVMLIFTPKLNKLINE